MELWKIAWYSLSPICGAKIPAAGALHQIAADRPHVTDLWRCRMRGGVGERGVVLLNRRMFRHFSQRHQRTDAQAARRFLNPATRLYVAYVDELLRRRNTLLHAVEHIGAA